MYEVTTKKAATTKTAAIHRNLNDPLSNIRIPLIFAYPDHTLGTLPPPASPLAHSNGKSMVSHGPQNNPPNVQPTAGNPYAALKTPCVSSGIQYAPGTAEVHW
jgi:hypothetical protein